MFFAYVHTYTYTYTGKLNQAFVLTNRYIDLSETMEEGGEDAASIENGDFEGTDVPFDFHLQETQYLPAKEREEIREWVLTLSMDHKVRQKECVCVDVEERERERERRSGSGC